MMQNEIFDIIVVGGGGAGLRAAIEASLSGLSVACLSKVYPMRSHTVVAQGGIGATLNNMGDGDHWQYHMYDTIKSSDWLGDQDAIEYMCCQAPQAIIELEHWGVPFSRTESGHILQGTFVGHTLGDRHQLAQRTCVAKDRTGQAILHTLYQKALSVNVTFFNEFFVLDLIMDNQKECRGVVAWNLHDGKLYRLASQAVVLATGGYSRIYQVSAASHICTGDGNAMVLRAALPLMDMEFVQFHPTGLYPSGYLIPESARSQGAYLLNKNGERFMEKYAPQAKEMAPRDIVTRSMIKEIIEGRGDGPQGDHLWLSVQHLSREVIENDIHGLIESVRCFSDLDVTKSLIPVIPTANYTMGGIPTTLCGEVIKNSREEIVSGLFAVGEAACVSVHGANRLGTNSLLDLIVFGKAVGERLVAVCKPGKTKPLEDDLGENTEAFFEHLLSKGQGTHSLYDIRDAMQKIIQKAGGIFRTPDLLHEGLRELRRLSLAFHSISLSDRGRIWNSELVDLLELYNLLAQAGATLESALFRTESRGSHFRQDYPRRDDHKWLCHTLMWQSLDEAFFETRPVRFNTKEVPPFLPEKRTY